MEFALVVPLLLALVMGIIDYGLWFNDSLNLRQGVREGARAGALAQFGPPVTGCSTAGSNDMLKLACTTKDTIGATGTTYVKVRPPASYDLGQTLLVCGIVKADGVTGLTPLPKDGLIRSKIKMTVEVKSATAYSDAMTGGASLDWSWCT